MISKLFVLAAVATTAAAIYPSDHWSYSTKYTDNTAFHAHVKEVVDSGKTLFAPGWNAIVKMFKDNPDVEFGDINLQDGCCRNGPNGGSLQAGQGGWPTVRFFNKDTGYDGGQYKKVTSSPMCTELGPGKPHLQTYIEGYGKTSADKTSAEPEL